MRTQSHSSPRPFCLLALGISTALLASSLSAQNLRPDMRTWTVTPSHASINVTKTTDKISWSACRCGNVAVKSSVRWQVPATGLYMMTTRTTNFDVSGTDPWVIGIRSPRNGDGFSRRWTESNFSAPLGEFPYGVGRLTKDDSVFFVDGRGSTFGGRDLRVELVRVEAPVFVGGRWSSFRDTQWTATITPRFPTQSQWLFFASPGRFASGVAIPGIAGAGLWLSAPILVMTQGSTAVNASFPFAARNWPKLDWQVLELHQSSAGPVLTLGSPIALFSI